MQCVIPSSSTIFKWYREFKRFLKSTLQWCGSVLGLDPGFKETDITVFELTRVYIPILLFNDVLDSLKYFNIQYGSLQSVFNEAGVSYLISNVLISFTAVHSCEILGSLLAIFEGGLLNKPEYTMAALLSTSRHVEITLFAGPSCIISVWELNYEFGRDSSDVLAQMLYLRSISGELEWIKRNLSISWITLD
jgi:hypothetical protein